jgi:hypothetical protein
MSMARAPWAFSVTTAIRAPLVLLLASTLAVAASACGRQERFAGYWQGMPNDGPERLVISIESSSAGYSIRGLWPFRAMQASLVGDTLVWQSAPPRKYKRIELSLGNGGSTLFVREYGPPGGRASPMDLSLVRPNARPAVLKAEMRAIAATRSAPAVRRTLRTLAASVRRWARAHAHRYPAARSMRPGGRFWLSPYAPALDNPLSDRPLRFSRRPGDFTYATSTGRRRFVLRGYLADGSACSIAVRR